MTMAIDRPAAIRLALRDLVAERGLQGASMNEVAKAAGVATGTAYVHYESKDELVIDTYLEVKSALTQAVLGGVDTSADLVTQYRQVFGATYAHLSEVPERARFLAQIEGSPYRTAAHARFLERGDRFMAVLLPMLERILIPLPVDVIWAMSLGLVIQLVASGVMLDENEVDSLVDATWRGISRPDH